MLKFIHRAWHTLRIFARSIRFRLTLWSVAILAIVLLAFSAFIYSRQVTDLRVESYDRLELMNHQLGPVYRFEALQILQLQQLGGSTSVTLQPPLLPDGDVLAFVGTSGSVVQKVGSISDQDVTAILQAWKNGGSNNTAFSSPLTSVAAAANSAQDNYLFSVSPLTVENQGLGILVLGTQIDPTGQLPRLLLTLLLGSLGLLAVAVAGGYWLAARVMHPVQIITRTAREISETDLKRRLNLDTGDELGELANTFDQMLARLQAAFERQRQFTADASHELRTPLTIVELEASRALAHRRPTDEYERTLRVIKSENEFMGQLVNDLLTLARMDAGQATLKNEPVDLSDIALDVVERLAPLAQRKNVALETGDLPEIMLMGDRQYLTQMLTNLVENGIKYSEGYGQRVLVETGCQEDGRALCGWVRVVDNGPGIPPEHLPHLFDRFYRVDSARSHNERDEDDGGERPSGSGLGLSIVQWIAKSHGGEVSVQSEPGKGSIFEVRLPALKGAPPSLPQN